MSRPTIQELDQQLNDLVNWERLAIHLPKITQTDIEIIKRDNSNNRSGQKLALYDKWLRSYPNASWDAVVLALEVIDENTLAKNIPNQYKQKVAPPILCKPTKHELKEKLKDLEQWESFATHLDGINQKDIDTIKKESHDDTDYLKQHLFEKWLNTHSDPSWEKIILALKRAGENELAQQISDTLKREVTVQEDIVLELSELHSTFSSLSFSFKKDIKVLVQSGDVTLADLVLRTQDYVDELTHVKTIDCFIQIILPQYNFLNCHILVVLVREFLNPSELLDKLQAHADNIKAFRNNTKIKYLYKTLTPFTTKSPQEVPVTIRVQNTWEEHDLKLIETLLKTLFRLKDNDIKKLFRVIPGSLTTVLLVPQHISLSLIEHSKHKIQFMKLTGIISLQIGDTYILQDEENDNYTFEQALIEATEAGNYEAVQFLLQQACVDANTQTEPDKESIVKIKELADKIYKDENNNLTFPRDAGTTALMIACCHGYTGIIQLLIKSNANLNLQTNSGWTGLMYTTSLGDTNITNTLLKHKADVNTQKFSNGATALIYACVSGNVQTVRALIKNLANINIKMNTGATPLHIASENGHLPVVKRLLQEKADPNTPANNGGTPLHVASYNGHLPVVERLLQEKVVPNTPRDDGATPLYFASQEGHLPVVERLLQEKVDPNTPTNNRATPLFIASLKGHLPVVERLLQEKVDPNTPTDNRTTPLSIACENGHLPVVERLLQEKVDPNIPNNDKATPLFIASRNGHLHVVERLLQEKVDPNTPNNDEGTPLFIASQNGHLHVVERLLQEKVDPNTPMNDGASPLFIASRNGHLPVVERLLQEKVNPNTPTDKGATPLFIASLKGHLHVVERLLQEKVDPNTPTNDGASPLFIASLNGHLPVVARLLQEEADPNAQKDDGATPLMSASFNGHPDVVQLLLIYNADSKLKTQDGLTALRLATEKGHDEVVSILMNY